MTPRDVDELSPEEYRALTMYANRELKARERAAKKR